MKNITIQTNRKQAVIEPKGGFQWTCSYQTSQLFEIKVTTEEADIGGRIGLVQQLVETSRVAQYTGGGELSIHPQREPPVPVLDADPDTIPFYNFACQSEQITAADEDIVLTMEDSPQIKLPSTVNHGGKNETITSLSVSEKFVLVLYSQHEMTNQQQWTWHYAYELKPDPDSVYKKPVVEQDVIEVATDTQYDEPLILEGPVATENPTWEWTWPSS